jgi:type II secretory pathway component PulF
LNIQAAASWASRTKVKVKLFACLALGQTGTLAEMLHSRHQTLECDLSHRLGILNQSLEPILILALGLMIGGLLMTLYLPIFSLGKII